MNLISGRSMAREQKALGSRSVRRGLLGTTLIEVLVTIVVFLVGILAIAQIFPGGVKILNRTRNTSMAVAMAKSQLEMMAAKPELVPEQILPLEIVNVGGVYTPVENPMHASTDFNPLTTGGISITGEALGTARNWQQVSGPNVFRRIVGEGHAIPTPRLLSTDLTSTTAQYGSLVTLELGPPDHRAGEALPGRFSVYSRDMSVRLVRSNADLANIRDYEFGVLNPSNGQAVIVFPARPTSYPSSRIDAFRVSFSAIVQTATGTTVRKVKNEVYVIPADDNLYHALPIATFPPLNLVSGEALNAIDPNSVRISRVYNEILGTATFSPLDPYTFKTVNARVGMYLFNPAVSQQMEERVGVPRSVPLVRFDYDLRDWRILHEDFRISESSPSNLTKVVRLSMPSIATNSVAGSDARANPSHDQIVSGTDSPNSGMEDVYVANNNAVAGANTTNADNVLVIDTLTGGQLLESFNGQPTMRIDKSAGTISFLDVTPNAGDAGLHAAMVFPDGSQQVTSITGRNLRIYYMVRGNWAVQLSRSAAKYSSSSVQPVGGEFYVGGSGALGGLPTRLYFPAMDANRKVSIGQIRYTYTGPSGVAEGVLEGAEFQVKYRTGSDTILVPMPSVDIRDVVASATGLSQGEFSVRDVTGISILAKVFNNFGTLRLGTDAVLNQSNEFNKYLAEWNVVTKETYLPRGAAIR